MKREPIISKQEVSQKKSEAIKQEPDKQEGSHRKVMIVEDDWSKANDLFNSKPSTKTQVKQQTNG